MGNNGVPERKEGEMRFEVEIPDEQIDALRMYGVWHQAKVIVGRGFPLDSVLIILLAKAAKDPGPFFGPVGKQDEGLITVERKAR